jgi:exodeoxyribonuclease VII small subunit
LAGSSREGRKFETKLADLEEIVSRLESGDPSLEESLALFEKGTGLLKELTSILEEAERKVELLTRDTSGTLVTEPLEEEENE